MSVEEKYKVLDDIEHLRARPGMYVGSTSVQTSEEWVYDIRTKKMKKQTISYIPALIKIFSEILDNSIDEHKRHPNILTAIKVNFDPSTGKISVSDNGSGIPVTIHKQTGKYVAETIFSQLRAGSNFNDAEDQQLIGTHGIGATATNILSTEFTIDSCDGVQRFTQTFSNGMRIRGEPTIKASTKNGTTISFVPDYIFFGLTKIDIHHVYKMIKKVVDAAACNSGVKFSINGDAVQINSFQDYIRLFNDTFVADITEDWKVGIAASDGFEHISFVNSVETYEGGTHVDYVITQIVDEVRAFFLKKHKIDVKPSDIRSHMRVFISANINRPKFSSQTKENMISLPSTYKTAWTVPEKMIKAILKTDIISSVLDWVTAKEQAAQLAELRKQVKTVSKASHRKVEKFTDAVQKTDRQNCILLITEGDSARNSVQSARGKQTNIGSFAARGKILNVYDVEDKDIVMPKKNGDLPELANLMIVLGLEFGKPVTHISQLRFGKICLLGDADLDGYHINGLFLSFFAKFWPELFKLGAIYRMVTPLYIAKHSKEVFEFFTDDEYKVWAKSAPKHTAEYYKGLGAFDTKDFKRFLDNIDKYLIKFNPLTESGSIKLNMAFANNKQDERKEWLKEYVYFNNEK